jgi:hypothetical protein
VLALLPQFQAEQLRVLANYRAVIITLQVAVVALLAQVAELPQQEALAAAVAAETKQALQQRMELLTQEEAVAEAHQALTQVRVVAV